LPAVSALPFAGVDQPTVYMETKTVITDLSRPADAQRGWRTDRRDHAGFHIRAGAHLWFPVVALIESTEVSLATPA
jgi:hypothetical protein